MWVACVLRTGVWDSRMIWKGHISFGLVNIPVALQPAEARNELDFTLLDERDLSPIGYRKVNKRTGKEVPGDRITRGFEHRKGRYVIVTDEDLRRASPERTQRIDILSFADPAEVAPMFYDRPYYLAPVAKSEKGYTLLREALRRTGKAGIASVVVRTRQYLAMLTVDESVLVLVLLRFASELRDPRAVGAPAGAKGAGITDREIRMAEQLVRDMSEPWNPAQYRDQYRSELMAFIRKRARSGREEEPKPAKAPRTKPAEVIDLMELLKRSVGKRRSSVPTRRSA
jgi:DNA end-binding protein Ku